MLGQIDTFIAFAVVILGVSLLITVLNQAVVAVLSLRGTNLLWGLQTLIECVHPELKAHSTQISEAVLRHPLISDSTWSRVSGWPLIGWFVARWKLASAIRVEELTEILTKLAESKGSQPWKKELAELLRTNRQQEEERRAVALAGAAVMAQSVGPGGGAPAAVAAQTVAQLKRAAGDLELWFGSIMDRVSQRFAAQMRAWTVVFAVLVAFALHIDASDIFMRIHSDAAMRAQLVASIEGMTADAQRIAEAAVPDAVRGALTRLKAGTPALANAALPAGPISRTLVREWIVQQKLGPDAERAALVAFDQHIRDETKDVLAGLARDADGIEARLSAAGLQLIPDFSVHYKDRWPDFAAASSQAMRHLLGILFSAMLLSLGAPFWFTVLKSAAALRPIIASKESAERERSRA